MAKELKFIENEGALFKGPSVSFPKEVWDRKAQAWSPYTGSTPKPQDWGDIISEEEANELMGVASEAEPA